MLVTKAALLREIPAGVRETPRLRARVPPRRAIETIPAADGGTPHAAATTRRSIPMLYTIAVVLLVLWLLGLVSGYAIGAYIHVLLVIAVVLFVVGLVSGRRRIV